MTTLRPELDAIVRELIAASAASKEVSLDALGTAIGARAVSQPEIDAMLTAIEEAGRRVTGPEGGSGEAMLAKVIAAARELRVTLGKAPSVAQLAAHTGLAPDDVRRALALAQVMQR